MSIRSRLPIAVALLAALAALVALLGVGSAAALPKIPKVIDRQVSIKVSGTVTYRWTYDSREKCTLGYSKTIEEELRFDFPARKTKMVVMQGKLLMSVLQGGTSQLDVRLGGWQTTNYCDPNPKAPEPPEPTCKSGASPLAVAITSTAKDLATEGDDELTPLTRESQVLINRTKPFAQNSKCYDQRPTIKFQFENELGWHADPNIGVALGMNAGVSQYGNLTKGKTIRRQIQISGGCGAASAHASAVLEARYGITKCTLDGVVFVTVTGR